MSKGRAIRRNPASTSAAPQALCTAAP